MKPFVYFQVTSCKVSSRPVIKLESVVDNALDCTYVFITSADGSQYRQLLEQRSSGYVWGGSFVPIQAQSREKTPRTTSEESLAAPRSRLSGLRQLSAVGLANLRSKLSEGRKMLDRKMSSSVSSVASSNSNLDTGADNPDSVDVQRGPQDISSRIGDTKISVQRNQSGTQVLAGIFPDSAVLTIHNCELEVLPQSAFKLPRGSNKVLLMGRIIVAASENQIHIVSAHHSEILVDSTNSQRNFDALLQTFTLCEEEVILAMVKSTLDTSSPDQSSGSEKRPHLGNRSASSESKSLTNFAKMTHQRVHEAKGRSSFPRSIIVTNQAVYCLQIDNEPSAVFLELAMRGRDIRQAESLALAFGLGLKPLLELGGDLRLCERDFSSAISLYRQSGIKHLKVVLKFACSGFIEDMLSYLTVLFKTPNLEVSPADRIHLSNLALMAYFQQILTKTTPTARLKFKEQIEQFLMENRWFDECLAIRLSSETREWDLLCFINQSRGLHYEMLESVVSILMSRRSSHLGSDDMTKHLTDLTTAERNGLLACLLHPCNAESVAVNKDLCLSYLDILSSILGLLEGPGLKSLIHQCGPINPGLRHVYGRLLIRNNLYLEDNDDYSDGDLDLEKAFLNLSISAMLLFLKKQSRCGVNFPIYPNLKVPEVQFGDQDIKMREIVLAAASSHVLFKKSERSLIAWGSTANGVLGHGATGSRFSVPKAIDFFSKSSFKVVAVSCGKTHSLALTNYGVYVWGSSRYGQLGLGPKRTSTQRPTLVPKLSDQVIVDIAAGQYHSVALDSQGRIWTWGWGVHGQLGHGDVEDLHEPVQVVCSLGREQVVRVEAGYAHTLALTFAKEVWVFGCGLFGQLGNKDNKKSTIPIKVVLDTPMSQISSGFFHNLALSENGQELFVWGCNPQILRLEAQQRKRIRMAERNRRAHEAAAQEENKQQQQRLQEPAEGQGNVATSLLKDIKKQARQALDDMRSNGGASNNNNIHDEPPSNKSSQFNGKHNEPEEEDESDAQHLRPTSIDISNVEGKIISMACGNQHSLLLSDRGIVYCFGRNVDGQLGTNSRKEEKIPTDITALKDDFICHIACGGDYSLAVNESGSVFAWGNNSFGQLGKPPLSEDGENSKVVVMKTTKRIIRLPNNVQNVCDVPTPVPGITNGIYSDETISAGSVAEDQIRHGKEAMEIVSKFGIFGNLGEAGRETELLHVTLEVFADYLQPTKVLKKCLTSDNQLAAAKMSLLSKNVLQAFEFTLQLSIKHKSSLETIVEAFLFYLQCADGGEQSDADQRRQLLERLIACWQDQKHSFLHLEKLFFANARPLLLQTLVLTLFRPETEAGVSRDGAHMKGPDFGGEGSGPKLVDLFTPEFCLKIGDKFVKDIKQEHESSENGSATVRKLERQASEVADHWLMKNQKLRGLD